MKLHTTFVLVIALGLACVTNGNRIDSSLLRTKRRPLLENDYIEESKFEILQNSDNDKSKHLDRRHTTENTTDDDLTESVFRNIIHKSSSKQFYNSFGQRLEKRETDSNKKDPFEKLKQFFDELKKRSVDESEEMKVEISPEVNTKSEVNEVKKVKAERVINMESGMEVEENDVVKSDSENNNSGSGSEESGSANTESMSGDAGSGSGEVVTINKRSGNENYDSLFKTKRSIEDVDDNLPNEREKREGKDTNPIFEGIPERLAVNNFPFSRENPRTKILRREAKNQFIPDIPLPFNKITPSIAPAKRSEEINISPEKEEEVKIREVRHVLPTLPRNTIFTKLIPFKEFKSIDVFKRSLGDETFNNLRIIDEEKAKSLFDSEEGEFLKNIKQDGVYYDTRNKRFLISAKVDAFGSNTENLKRVEHEKKTVKRSDVTDSQNIAKDITNSTSPKTNDLLPNVSTTNTTTKQIKNETGKLDAVNSINANKSMLVSENIIQNTNTLFPNTTAVDAGAVSNTTNVDIKGQTTKSVVSNTGSVYTKAQATKAVVSNAGSVDTKGQTTKELVPNATGVGTTLKEQNHNNLDITNNSEIKSLKTPSKVTLDNLTSEERTIALNIVKRMLHSLEPIKKHLTMKLIGMKKRKALESKRITKREILSDDDPNIDLVMGADGNKIEDDKKIDNINKAEKVFKFARSIIDIVGNHKNKKEKRHVDVNPTIHGVWSGLGTTPEFVRGLFKRETSRDTKNAEGEKVKIGTSKQQTHNKGKSFIEKKVKSSSIENMKLQEKRQLDFDETDDKNNEDKESEEDVEEIPLLNKRNIIPKDDDLETDEDKKSDVKEALNEMESEVKQPIEVMEQSESKQMEVGSLGSFNMLPRKVIKKTLPESEKNSFKTKRSDKESEVDINHTTYPVQDGKVVLAFDEVKELMPTKRFFSSNEEKILGGPIYTETEKHEMDKDLADNMVLTGDKKSDINQTPSGLTATVEYERNFDNTLDINERSKVRTEPTLVKDDDKLHKSQMDYLRQEEAKTKYNQMKNWANLNKESLLEDEKQVEIEKEIQEASNQLAESDAELQKLRMLSKPAPPPSTPNNADTAYLAKKLEEKSNSDNDSPEDREKKFQKLQSDILEEQGNYRKLLRDQQLKYKEMLKTDVELETLRDDGYKFQRKDDQLIIKPGDSYISPTRPPIKTDASLSTGTKNTVLAGQNSNNFNEQQNSIYNGEMQNTALGEQQNIKNLKEHYNRVHDKEISSRLNESHSPQSVEHYNRVHNQYAETTIKPSLITSTDAKTHLSTKAQPLVITKLIVVTPKPVTEEQLTVSTTVTPTYSTTSVPVFSELAKSTTTVLPNLLNLSTTNKLNISNLSTTAIPASTVISTEEQATTTTPVPTTTSTYETSTAPLSTTYSTVNTTVSQIVSTTPHIQWQAEISTTIPLPKNLKPEQVSQFKTTTANVPTPSATTAYASTKVTYVQTLLSLEKNLQNTTKGQGSFTSTQSTAKIVPTTLPIRLSTSTVKRKDNISLENEKYSNQSKIKLEKGDNKENLAAERTQEEHIIPDLTTTLKQQIILNATPTEQDQAIMDLQTKVAVAKDKALLNKANNNGIHDKQLVNERKKFPFPLDLAYQPRKVNVTSKKKLEIEPRSDGYVGCYLDHLESGRDLPVRAGIPFVTPNNCRSACKKTGYKYAGLQYGYLCFCGNNYGKYDIVPDSECNNICSGNSSFTCGGLWRNEVFSTENALDESNESPVPFYLFPEHKNDAAGVAKSSIPSYRDRIIKGEQLLRSLQTSKYSDLKSLQAETQDAVSRSHLGYVRNIQNLTDDEIVNSVRLQMNLDKAAERDIDELNHQADQTSDKTKNKTLQSFTYMHPQNEAIEELQHSPVQTLKIEPGTHLFRGEIMLKQKWHDELSKPESVKYKILSGNIENAVKNIFENDANFLKAEVMSLKEANSRNPHKTLADFSLTFHENTTAHLITNKLFNSVLNTEKLDDMPVLPQTLKIKEYLLDAHAQAYIPKVVDGSIQFDTSAPIPLRYNNENKLIPAEQLAGQKQFLPLKNSSQSTNLPIITSQQKSNIQPPIQSIVLPINHPLVTHIRPVLSDGMAELHNYMSTQNENAAQRGIVTKPVVQPAVSNQQPVQSAAVLQSNLKKRKVPYVLRMFFWKDMLARKKREYIDIDELQKYKNQAHRQTKIVHFTDGLPMIRDRRSQADEWPINHKTDAQKPNHYKKPTTSILNRKRRVLPIDEIKNNNTNNNIDEDFTSLFKIPTQTFKVPSKRLMKRELVSDFVIKSVDVDESTTASTNKRLQTKANEIDTIVKEVDKKTGEIILHRSKRNEII